MARTPSIPPALRAGPFTLDEARAAGLTPSALRGPAWRRVGKGIYRWTKGSADPWLLISAWRRACGSDIAFSGYTAAWMHGIDCAPAYPIEITVPLQSHARSCNGLIVHHCDLSEEDVTQRRRLRLTDIRRTLRDICFAKAPLEALVIIDAAIRRRLTDCAVLLNYANTLGPVPGSAKLRALAELAAPAESPMETRLRSLLVNAGLPRPEVQTDLYDARGRLLGRADLYYPRARLAIEYDGGNHRDRLISDDRRQNELVAAGYTVLRFTSADYYGHPDALVAQVSALIGQIERNAASKSA